ncbi:polysaccharide pyruvyl transferase family protein [Arthrobacter sp. OAP107]|uniref:polysaccharide pyruvyl transferase family protein n=1 Tax=Arthrobacter sp. OAP107 TaxID=3156445 RepID=UPI003399E0E7
MIVLTGAYGNIGDAVIRRRVLNWVRDLGEIHAYVGNAPGGWIEQMGFEPDDRVYSAASSFSWMKLVFAPRRPKALVFDPGEISLARNSIRSELLTLALTFLVRMRGGVVVRPPRGISQSSGLGLFVHRLGARFAKINLWRTQRSFDIVGDGSVVPDTAFQEPFVPGLPWDQRRTLVISMRGKRKFPSDAWFSSMDLLAQDHGYCVVVLSQVREDEERSREIAERLKGRHLEWGSRSDLDHERLVRGVYSESAVVISDRLHVLVLAAVAGCIPIEVSDSPRTKVSEHFAQIGVHNMVIDSAIHSAEDIVRRAKDACRQRSRTQRALSVARELLDIEEMRIKGAIDKTALVASASDVG